MFAKAATPATTGGPGTVGGHCHGSPANVSSANKERCAGWVFNRHTWPGCCPGADPNRAVTYPPGPGAESGVARPDRASQAEERLGRVAEPRRGFWLRLLVMARSAQFTDEMSVRIEPLMPRTGAKGGRP